MKSRIVLTKDVFFLAFFFISSHVGLMLPEFAPVPSSFLFVISVGAMIPLWTRRLSNNHWQPKHPKLGVIQFLILLIFGLGLCSSVAYLDSDGIKVFAKTGGLILTYLTVFYCSRNYSAIEIASALLMFAFCELALMYFTKGEWNANSAAARCATAGIVGFYVAPVRYLRWLSFGLGLTIAFQFQSRTVLVASVCTFFLMWIVQRVPKNRELVFIGFLVIAMLLISFADSIQQSARAMAKDSLGSSHPIAKFFLDDKDEKDIDGDFLDRADVWADSVSTIKKHPLLGVGLGNEAHIAGRRSHNAFLTLAVEGGIPSTIIWLLFYLTIGQFLVFQTPNFQEPTANRLMQLATFLLIYMSMSAMAESAGIGSVSAPNNLICLFITFWAMSNWQLAEQPNY